MNIFEILYSNMNGLSNVYVVLDYCGPNPLLNHDIVKVLGAFRKERDAWAAIQMAVDGFINQNDGDVYTSLVEEVSSPTIKIQNESKRVQVVIPIQLGCSETINRHHFYKIVSVTLS